MRRVLRELTFALLSVAAVGMIVVLVLVMSGRLVSDPAAAPPKPPPVRKTVAAVSPAAVEHAHVAAPAKTRMSISAVRGDCWLEVRKSSARGELLFSGVLRQGDSHVFAAARLWLRLGAAGNVDVTVDGKELDVPSGTPELTLPA